MALGLFFFLSLSPPPVSAAVAFAAPYSRWFSIGPLSSRRFRSRCLPFPIVLHRVSLWFFLNSISYRKFLLEISLHLHAYRTIP